VTTQKDPCVHEWWTPDGWPICAKCELESQDYIFQLEARIKEYENRKCETCTFFYTNPVTRECLYIRSCPTNFGCNRWEAK